MKNIPRIVFFLVPIIVSGLCFKFLRNDLVFDDIYFFLKGAPEKFFAEGFYAAPRWWVYETLAATFVFLGSDLLWFRLGNLIAHTATVFALYFLIFRLLLDIDQKYNSYLNAEWAAFVAALFFAVHPLAIFTQAYLIQRTIVCATLFSLLTWLAFWRGLSGSRLALWSSCLFYLLAVYAKEHAVMVPIASFLFLVLFVRSGLKVGLSWREVAAVLLVQSLCSISVVLQMKGVIGNAYEIMTPEVLEGQVPIAAELLYPLSVLNQAGLFFKYALLWLIPNPAWLSIDIREAFPLNFNEVTLLAGGGAFTIYALASAALLFRGGLQGLLGLVFLVPCLLFFTELSSVRLQEPFVIYRSYLWAPTLFIALAILIRQMSKSLCFMLLPISLLAFMALSYDRLMTLSHPYLVWNEAAQLFEKQTLSDGRFGAYRIYYNRGMALYGEGMLDSALDDFELVLKLKSNYAHAHHQKGVIYLDQGKPIEAMKSFEKAIELLPSNLKSYLGRAKALENKGDIQEAKNTYRVACSLGSQFACKKLGG